MFNVLTCDVGSLGRWDGWEEGCLVGKLTGCLVGCLEGRRLGWLVGFKTGWRDGDAEGYSLQDNPSS